MKKSCLCGENNVVEVALTDTGVENKAILSHAADRAAINNV